METNPRFSLEIFYDSWGGIAAEFEELPPKSAEVLGPSTVQFIKRLSFWEGPEHLDGYPPEFSDPLSYMERLETLTLDCLSGSLKQILLILTLDAVCPLLRMLIVRLPEDEAAGE